MTGRVFSFPQKVLFRHCDPAGIVFFPRYFEMINDCTEAFFAEVLNAPWEVLHDGGATPTVTIETTFQAPSRHGDMLNLALSVTRIGVTSLGISVLCSSGSQTRFQSTSTLVYVDGNGRPQAWPDTLRTALAHFTGDDT
jgi:4-hydroxybenzoyl-CoA thioesterase